MDRDVKDVPSYFFGPPSYRVGCWPFLKAIFFFKMEFCILHPTHHPTETSHQHPVRVFCKRLPIQPPSNILLICSPPFSLRAEFLVSTSHRPSQSTSYHHPISLSWGRCPFPNHRRPRVISHRLCAHTDIHTYTYIQMCMHKDI